MGEVVYSAWLENLKNIKIYFPHIAQNNHTVYCIELGVSQHPKSPHVSRKQTCPHRTYLCSQYINWT